MGQDRSLDEFFGGNGGSADDDTGSDADTSAEPVDGATTDADGDADASDDAKSHLPDASAVDLPMPTYRWAPEGAACTSCGSIAERRWTDDGAFVCDDCKEW